MFSGFRHISLTLLPKPFGKQKRWWIFNWNFTTELLRHLTEIDILLFIDWNLNVLFSKYIMQVKESKSKQKCKFFHKPLAEILKISSFQRLPIIKKSNCNYKESPEQTLIEIYISNGVVYFRFGAITVPSKFYDNITLFTPLRNNILCQLFRALR